jgi:GT2 family glycosyltransferase
MVKKVLFEEVGGFDEKYRSAFYDVDFCLKLRDKGYLNVWTPYAVILLWEAA